MNLVVLTGAGVSAESGLATFRDLGGLWAQVRLEEVATPEAFAADPGRVQGFYDARRAQLARVSPNPAHHALAMLEQGWTRGTFLLVTQNVDDLHERAGSRRLRHMHGELKRARCLDCGAASPWEGDIAPASRCPACGLPGRLRPHVVWFGEVPLHMEEISSAVAACDVFVSVGTSGQVWPAAGFVRMLPAGARSIEVNPMATEVSPAFREHRRGPASVEVPRLVAELLA